VGGGCRRTTQRLPTIMRMQQGEGPGNATLVSEMSCGTNMTEATAKLERRGLRWRRLKSVRVLQFLPSSSSKDLFEGHHRRPNQRPSTSFSGQGRIEHLAPDPNTELVTPVTSWSQCGAAGHKCPKMVTADPKDAKNSQHTTIASPRRPIERY